MSRLPEGVTVRKATDREVESALSYVCAAQREYADYYIVLYEVYSLVFELMRLQEGIYEGHVVVPKDSRIASRALTLVAVQWVFNIGAPECKLLITTCPEGKTSNMLRRLNWKDVTQHTEGKDIGLNVFALASTNLNPKLGGELI